MGNLLYLDDMIHEYSNPLLERLCPWDHQRKRTFSSSRALEVRVGKAVRSAALNISLSIRTSACHSMRSSIHIDFLFSDVVLLYKNDRPHLFFCLALVTVVRAERFV